MSRILSGVVLCGAALHGQVQVQVLAHTQLAVVNQSIPANTDITSGATLQWLVTVPYYSSATMSVAVSPARVSFSNAIVGSPSAVPSIGQHAIRVRLSSTLPTEVTLRAEVYASASSSTQVDIGNDNSIEATVNHPWATKTDPAIYEKGASGSCVGSHGENQGLATAFALQPFHDRAVSAQEAMRHRTGRWRLSQATFEGVGRGACVARPTPVECLPDRLCSGSGGRGATVYPHDFSMPHEKTVTLTSLGLEVVIRGSAIADFGGLTGDSFANLSFLPTGRHVTRSDAPCGIELAGAYSMIPGFPPLFPRSRTYLFDLTYLPATQGAFLILGSATLNAPIPPIGCALRTDLLLPIAVPISPLGRSSITLAVPSGLTSLDARAQNLSATLDPLSNPLWRTSQVVQLRF